VVRSAYQDALPHAVDTPDGRCLKDAAGEDQPPTDAVLILVVPSRCLNLGFGDAIIGLSDANDHHHLVVRPNDVSVNALGLRVDGAAALIVELLRTTGVLWAFALHHIVVWRPALRRC
jgi:hypothetical protein